MSMVFVSTSFCPSFGLIWDTLPANAFWCCPHPKYPETLCSNTGRNSCNIFILSTYKGHLILASGNSRAFSHLQRRWHRSDVALWPHPTACAPVAWLIINFCHGKLVCNVYRCSTAPLPVQAESVPSSIDDIRKKTHKSDLSENRVGTFTVIHLRAREKLTA